MKYLKVIEFLSIIVSSFVTTVTYYCIKQTGDIWLHLGGRTKFKSFQLLTFLLFKATLFQSNHLLRTLSNPVLIDSLSNLAHVNKILLKSWFDFFRSTKNHISEIIETNRWRQISKPYQKKSFPSDDESLMTCLFYP